MEKLGAKATRVLHRTMQRHLGQVLLPTQLTILGLLVCAALQGRSLRLADLARNLLSQTGFRHRHKRIQRFLANPRIRPETVFASLLKMILALPGFSRNPLLPVAFDESALPADCSGVFAAIPWLGRALPFAFTLFRYGLTENGRKPLEWALLDTCAALLRGCGRVALFLLDRGYADVRTIGHIHDELHAHFVLRAQARVWIDIPGGYRGPLGGLDRTGTWYGVRYQQHAAMSVNLVVFRGVDKYGQRELIFLVTDISPEQARRHYQQRMRIEESFRDLKTTLGLKRLWLHVDPQVRLGRVLLAAQAAVILAGWLYPLAAQVHPLVCRHLEDLSFLRLVVEVGRQLDFWTRGFG